MSGSLGTPLPPPPPTITPPPPAAPEPRQDNPLAVWALVLGVLGFIFPLVSGVPAIVLGVLGRARAREGAPNGGIALAGLILGIITVAFWVLIIALAVLGAVVCNAHANACT